MTTVAAPNDNFESVLREFQKAVKLTWAKVIEAFTKELYDRIREKTPVDTGRAASSWRITVGTPSLYVPPAIGFPPAPSADDVRIDGTQPVHIVSNLFYVEFLENGSSQQAPNGMVALSIAELKAEAETVIARAIADAA